MKKEYLPLTDEVLARHLQGEATIGIYRKFRGVSFKDAEQAVIAPVGAPNPHLVEASHVIVHYLPLASPGEGRRRGLGDGLKHGLHFGPDLGGDLIKEVDRRDSLGLVVAGVAPEEVDQPRLGAGP